MNAIIGIIVLLTTIVVISATTTDTHHGDVNIKGEASIQGLTASRALQTDGSKQLESSAVTTTELGYVSGVSSAIQTQLDALNVLTTNGDIPYYNSSAYQRLAKGSDDQILTLASGLPSWEDAAVGASANTVIGLNDFQTNADFEEGDGSNWTNAGSGSFSVQNSTVGDGTWSASWNAAADGDTLTSDAWTVPEKLKNNNAVFCFVYQGGDTDIRVIGYDGSNDFFDESLAASTDWTPFCVNAIMPDVSTITLRLEADADAAVIYADNFQVGLASLVNIKDTSTAEFYGAVKWTETANCIWSTTSASYAGFSADADCTSPTGSNVEGNAEAPATKIPAIKFTNLPPGRYVVKAISRFYMEDTATSINGGYRFHDGSSALNGRNGYAIYDTDNIEKSMAYGAITGEITYSTTQSSVTIEIQALTTGTAYVYADSSRDDLYISVYRFPLNTEVAYKPGTGTVLWSGYHTSNCSWNTTSTSLVLPTGDATCDLTEQQNVNMGTVSSVADGTGNQPAITFTPPRVGVYQICAGASLSNSVASGLTTGALLYGATVLDEALVHVGGTDGESPVQLCGLLNVSSIASHQIDFKIGVDANTGSISYFTGLRSGRLYWKIFPVSQSLPMPQILNNVESSASGGVRVTSTYITNSGTPTVSREDGDWISSITDNGVGDMTINIVAGTFSVIPNCTCSAHSNRNCSIAGTPSTTALQLTTRSLTDAAGDFDLAVICVGAK